MIWAKQLPREDRARWRVETRDALLEGSLYEQSGRYWSYLEMPMNSHYVGRHLSTPVGQRKYAEARDSGKGKFALYNYFFAAEWGHEREPRLPLGTRPNDTPRVSVGIDRDPRYRRDSNRGIDWYRQASGKYRPDIDRLRVRRSMGKYG